MHMLTKYHILHISHKQRNIIDFFILFLMLAGNAYFLSCNAFRCFNFFDMGSFLDAGWRVFNGQKPYRDFIFTTGPVHLYMSAFFYMIFGFGKSAILAHLITVHSVVIITTFFILRKIAPRIITFMATLLVVTSFYWPISHPWYDQSAHFWGIIAIGFLVKNIPFIDKKRAFLISALCAALAVISFLTKTNIGFCYGVVFFLFCMISNMKKDALLGYATGAILTLLAMAVAIGSHKEYIEQVFYYSQHVSGRLTSLLHPLKWLINYYWIPTVIVLLFTLSYIRKHKELAVLFVGTFFVAVVSAHTSNMLKSANIPLWGVLVALGYLFLYNVKGEENIEKSKIKHRIAVKLLFFTNVCLVVISVYYGLSMQAWTYVRGKCEGNYKIRTEPLDGWRCEKREGMFFDGMADFINQYVPKEDSLLILADMQILYAATGRESYKGVPFIFQTDELPVPGRQVEQVRENIMNNLPDWVLWNLQSPTYGVDLMRYLEISDIMKKEYISIKKWEYYALMRHK